MACSTPRNSQLALRRRGAPHAPIRPLLAQPAQLLAHLVAFAALTAQGCIQYSRVGSAQAHTPRRLQRATAPTRSVLKSSLAAFWAAPAVVRFARAPARSAAPRHAPECAAKAARPALSKDEVVRLLLELPPHLADQAIAEALAERDARAAARSAAPPHRVPAA